MTKILHIYFDVLFPKVAKYWRKASKYSFFYQKENDRLYFAPRSIRSGTEFGNYNVLHPTLWVPLSRCSLFNYFLIANYSQETYRSTWESNSSSFCSKPDNR